ncbi:MAG: TetR/AcrR family transcriptional regulator [Desulfobacterales bacterium]|nr:TetR/AcrR family transcriptional regulator [Desulfobacterales bacterium]
MKYALMAFANKGILRASHTDIAELAKVSVATVFNYFNTKKILLDAVLSEVERFFLSLALEIYQDKTEGLKSLLNHAYSFVETANTNEDYIKIWLEWGTSIKKETWSRYLAFQGQLIAMAAEAVSRAQVKGQIPDNVPALDIAYFFIGCAQPIVIKLYTPGQDVKKVNEFIDRIIIQLLEYRKV